MPTTVTKLRRRKVGRPTNRKNGRAYTGAERAKRFRDRRKQERKQAELLSTCEWYTPKRYIDAARKVLRSIDLDPATSKLAQTVVKAKTFYTAEDDGLSKQWHGRVWLYPPYIRHLAGRFVNKLLDEIAAGNVRQAILMLHSRSTGTNWFQRAATAAECFCIPSKRIICWSPPSRSNRPLSAPPSGSTFFHYGSRVAQFRKVFGQFGFVSSFSK
jgi:DNA N-6-adenine-methyltransferase (Dam)